MFSIREIIDIAVKLEKNGETIYLTTGRQTQNREFRNLLNWMASEESEHAEQFLKMKHGILADDDHPGADKMRKTLVDRFIGNQAFSLKDVVFSEIKDQRELIKVMIDFEKDTILFYELMKTFVKEKASQSTLNQIISEEKKHIQKLEALESDSAFIA